MKAPETGGLDIYPLSDTISVVSAKVHDEKLHNKKAHMHQTTVRFGRDLWEVLEQEAERLGVSAAQYVRDATLARLAYTAARQDEAIASREAFEWVGQAPLTEGVRAPISERGEASLEERVEAQLESAAALQAQGKLARGKAERLRAEATELRARSNERKR
jgi:hypothetical protein